MFLHPFGYSIEPEYFISECESLFLIWSQIACTYSHTQRAHGLPSDHMLLFHFCPDSTTLTSASHFKIMVDSVFCIHLMIAILVLTNL